MSWVLVRNALQFLMSAHNIYFYGEMKISPSMPLNP